MGSKCCITSLKESAMKDASDRIPFIRACNEDGYGREKAVG